MRKMTSLMPGYSAISLTCFLNVFCPFLVLRSPLKNSSAIRVIVLRIFKYESPKLTEVYPSWDRREPLEHQSTGVENKNPKKHILFGTFYICKFFVNVLVQGEGFEPPKAKAR